MVLCRIYLFTKINLSLPGGVIEKKYFLYIRETPWKTSLLSSIFFRESFEISSTVYFTRYIQQGFSP